MIKSVLKEFYTLLAKNKSVLDISEEVFTMRNKLENPLELTQFVNYIRSIVQQEAKEAIIKNGGKGLVVMATGAGKSKVAVDLALHYAKASSEFKKIAVIVPTEKLRDENWKDEFYKWDGAVEWSAVTGLCYASGSKVKDQLFELVILDEAHNITELSSEFFVNNQCTNVIGLTATAPTDKVKQKLLDEIGLNVVYTLTLDKAVKLGFVAPYKITVVQSPLESTLKEIPGGTKVKPFMTTEAAQIQYLNRLVQQAMFDKTPTGRKRLQFATLKRMRAVYDLPSKKRVAQFLLDKVIPKEERILIFCGGIEQAEELCEHTYHSKSGNADYVAFKEGTINRLSCVKAVNEGHNFEELDGALIVQLSSQEKDLIQRIGRLIRYRPDHQAHVYIVVAEGTQDMKWLDSALGSTDKRNIEYVPFINFKNRFE
jgi:superfamily II DNA or RNA helicase